MRHKAVASKRATLCACWQITLYANHRDIEVMERVGIGRRDDHPAVAANVAEYRGARGALLASGLRTIRDEAVTSTGRVVSHR